MLDSFFVPHKIALTGKMRSGKDTAALRLIDHHKFNRFAFADELKRYAYDIFDISEKSKQRKLLQIFGEKMCEIDPNVWVNKLEKNIQNIEHFMQLYPHNLPTSFKVVITDLRKPIEYKWAVRNNYVIIRINADEDTRLQRMQQAGDVFTEDTFNHVSERHIDGYNVHYDIDNNGTIDELNTQIDKVLQDIYSVASVG